MVPLYESIKDYDLDSENKINTKNNLQIQTHCHNCGAPVNPYLEKCEYCGTYYTNNSYANYLKGKYLEASIKNENAILSSQLKEELDNYNKDKRVKGSLKNLKKLYEEEQLWMKKQNKNY